MKDASADAGWTGGLFDLIASGGPIVAILVAMSVAALTIVLVKLWQFRRMMPTGRDVGERAVGHWRRGERREALALSGAGHDPVSLVLSAAMRGQRDDIAEPLVREEVARIGNAQLELLRQWLRPLEVIAALAPLLGLLGTVLGMIEAFRQMELAGNQVNPAVLSGGIWEALLTTAVGLSVAIPAVVALNGFERRIERLAHEMDDAVARVFTVDLGGGKPEAEDDDRTSRPAIVRSSG